MELLRPSLSEIDTFHSAHMCVGGHVVEVLEGQRKEYGLVSRWVEEICRCSLIPMGKGSRAQQIPESEDARVLSVRRCSICAEPVDPSACFRLSVISQEI